MVLTPTTSRVGGILYLGIRGYYTSYLRVGRILCLDVGSFSLLSSRCKSPILSKRDIHGHKVPSKCTRKFLGMLCLCLVMI
jgi:hypothetical protein